MRSIDQVINKFFIGEKSKRRHLCIFYQIQGFLKSQIRLHQHGLGEIDNKSQAPNVSFFSYDIFPHDISYYNTGTPKLPDLLRDIGCQIDGDLEDRDIIKLAVLEGSKTTAEKLQPTVEDVSPVSR